MWSDMHTEIEAALVAESQAEEVPAPTDTVAGNVPSSRKILTTMNYSLTNTQIEARNSLRGGASWPIVLFGACRLGGLYQFRHGRTAGFGESGNRRFFRCV